MNWFFNLKTKSKLLWAFGVICAGMVAIGFFADTRIALVNGSTVELATNWLPSVRHVEELNVQGAGVRRKELQHLLSTTAQEFDVFERDMRDHEMKMKETRKLYEPLISSPEERRMYERFSSAWDSFLAEKSKVVALSRQNKNEEAKLMSRGDELRFYNEAMAAADELVKINVQGAETTTIRAGETFSNARKLLVLSFVLLIAVAMAIAIITARPIEQGLAKAVEALQAVANRDFTHRLDIETRDEVGEMAGALNEAVGAMQTALKEVRDVADTVATASQQLSASAEEISGGAQEQASSLEETSANLEEITTTVKQNADNAQQASQLASGARDVADKGGTVVGRAVEAMGEINTASKRIADIITTIDEIAFQTNLLALNAAVEAARAGEQGRGFAVVAAEVRNLAQRSAGAAKEIKTLIQDSVRKVESGADLVNQSGQRLEEIVTSVKRVTDLVAEVAAASRDQSVGIDQVKKAVSQMDTVTQANSAQTEELSGTADAMSTQAEQLQKLVAQFRLGDENTRRPPVAALSSVRRPQRKRPVSPTASLKAPPRTHSAPVSSMDAAIHDALAAKESSSADGSFENV